MDELMNQLSQFLSTEGGQNALKGISSLLDGSSPSSDGPDILGALSSLMGSDEDKRKSEGADKSSFDYGEIIRLFQVLSQTQENDDSKLLLSLKPYLKDERKEKVDQAVKILKLMEMLPVLRESGILSSLL